MQPRFKERYEKEIVGKMTEKFGYKNQFAVPKLDKIVINMGVGEATANRGFIDGAVNDMTLIAGQKPVVTKARKSNASFKVRDAMPRIRDFRGINGKSFDGRGNYAMGITEHIVFPEIDYDKVDKIRGMDIIICTTAKTDEEAKELLRGFDMPFKN